MKKNLKLLIIIGSALIIVVAALLLLLFWPSDNTTNLSDDIDEGTDISVASNDEGVLEAVVVTTPEGEIDNNSYGTLIDYIPAKIKQIDVENESGTYTVTSYTPTTTKVNDDGEEETVTDSTVYTLVGYEKFDLATGIPESIANDAASLEFTKVAKLDCQNLSEFGLDAPRSTVHIKYTDGSKAVVKVGSVAPAGAGVYVLFGDSNDVYLVAEDSVDGFLVNLLDMFDKNINTAAESDDNAKFSSITISGSNFPDTIVMEQNSDETVSAYYKLTSPSNVFVSVLEGSLVTGGIRGLYAEEVVCVNPSASQLEKFGLKTPYAEIKAVYPDVTVNLIASKPASDNLVYLMSKGGNVVYTIKADKVPWVTTSYDELLSEYVICPTSSALTGVKVNDGSNTYNFTVETKSTTVTDDDGEESTKTTTTAYYGDKELDLTNFEYMCQEFVSLTRNDVVTNSPSGSVVMTIEYSYSTDRSNDVVTIYDDGGSDEYLAALNGGSVGHVSKATVNKIKAFPAKVAKDESITG